MKRKHKMNIGLAFLVIALMVVSSSMAAVGSVIKNEKVKENNIATTNLDPVYVGYILIDTKDHTTCDDPIVKVTPEDFGDIQLSDSGTKVTFYATYYILCPGGADHAWVHLSCNGKEDGFDYGLGGPDGKPAAEGELEIEVTLRPTRDTISVKLDALYKDHVTDIFPEVTLGDVTKWAYGTAKGIPMFGVSSTSIHGTDRSTGSASASFEVKNTGGKNSDLYWKITNLEQVNGEKECSWSAEKGGGVKLYLDKKYGPVKNYDTPGTGTTSIIVHVSGLPSVKRFQKEKIFEGKIELENYYDSSQKATVTVTITVMEPRSKSMLLPFHNVLQTQFPQLFVLLQSLPAFQR